MDYYEILGVPPTASVSDIRKAYAKIARDRHPDRFADPVEKERAQEFFKDATAAFNTLSSEKSRAAYDVERQRPTAKTPEEQAALAVAEAQELAKAGDLGGAIERMRQAAYLQPQEIKHREFLGRLLSKHPQTAREGIQVLEEVTRQDPKNAAAFLDLAYAFQAQGLNLRARKAAEAALAFDPASAAASTLLVALQPSGSDSDKGGGFLRRKP